jgi:pullulanase/glycogen debranching enzyme
VQAVFIAINRDADPTEAKLPSPAQGWHWVRVLDTAAGDPFTEAPVDDRTLPVPGEAIAVAVTRRQDA